MVDTRDQLLRRSGDPPYFPAGSPILWRCRRAGVPDVVRPVTVVRDDAEALVVWLASGTPLIRTVAHDGREPRDVPLADRMRMPRTARHGQWRGNGTLKIAPTGAPWSIWVFWDDDWNHDCWYANLESAHVRDSHGIVTQDHVLDVVVRPDRTIEWKDRDELAAAVEVGWFAEEQAEQIRGHAREVEALVAAWESPFVDGWPDWRPDPAWPVPTLELP